MTGKSDAQLLKIINGNDVHRFLSPVYFLRQMGARGHFQGESRCYTGQVFCWWLSKFHRSLLVHMLWYIHATTQIKLLCIVAKTSHWVSTLNTYPFSDVVTSSWCLILKCQARCLRINERNTNKNTQVPPGVVSYFLSEHGNRWMGA